MAERNWGGRRTPRNPAPVSEIKTCTKCGETKKISDFPLIGKTAPGKYRAACLECKRNSYRKANHPNWEKELNRQREAKFQSRFGISTETRDKIIASVNYQCMACGDSEIEAFGNLGLDHDHSCCDSEKTCGKCIRGVLCFHCNLALGYLKDDPNRVKGLLNYLEVSNFGESTWWLQEAK